MLETKCQENARAIVQQIKGSGTSTGHTYSTTAKKVGVWIDGKDIMERVFHLETPYQGRSTGGTFPDAVNTVLEAADTIISMYGIGSDACVSIGVDSDGETIRGYTFSDWSLTDLIVQYTVAPIL